MQGLWIGIMAVAFVLTLLSWIAVVLRAARSTNRRPQESIPQREMIGGTFVAREGGRQVMPDPRSPAEPPGPRSDYPR